VNRKALLLVFVTALAVRVSYVLVLEPSIRVISDAYNFHTLGELIRHNRGYIVPSEWAFLGEARTTAEFVPLHPTFLAAANLVGLDTIRQQQLFMGVVGSITPVLVALVGWRLTSRTGVALSAGLLAAVDPMLFGSDGALMTETVYVLFATLLVLLLLRARRDVGPASTASARQSLGVAAGAGAALGFAVLTRGDGLLLAPFVVVPLLWRRWRELAVVAVSGALVVSPWVIRNYVRFDQVILSTNVGQLINGANCPETYADGPDLGNWNFDCAYRIELVGNEAVDSARLREKGIEYAREHADRLPIVVPARVARGWHLLQPFGQAEREATVEGRIVATQNIGVVLTWVLLPLALAGAWMARRRRVEVTPIAGPILMVTVLFAGTYGISRFGASAHPGLVVGAVIAVTSLIDRLRGRSVDAV
jgi:4-amino-4-deoxy-L-arabinose transferase-like glycosyltransferase